MGNKKGDRKDPEKLHGPSLGGHTDQLLWSLKRVRTGLTHGVSSSSSLSFTRPASQ